MHETQQTAELIITPVARRYLTGFEASDGYLVLFGGRKYLFADSRYFEAAKNTVTGAEVRLLENETGQLTELFRELDAHKISVETDITVEELARLRDRFPESVFEPSQKLTDTLRQMRAVKSEPELELIRKAQGIAERAFRYILGYIRVGMSEKQIAAELDHAMRRFGAEKSAFDTVVVSGKRSSLPHGVPSYKSVEPGDFVTMDFGAVCEGYHSDMTRTVAVGRADEEMRAVYETVFAAQKNALSALRAGADAVGCDAAARDVIRRAGYGAYFGHGTGHGVGLEIHEAPSLSPKSEAVLCAGNVVTVEPGIYIPGKFGVRIEDMAYITETGAENLTDADKTLLVL